MLIRTTSVLLLMIALTGCSDPKAANEANFTSAIQAHLDASYPKCYILGDFPINIEFDFFGLKQKMQALAAAGLVVESEEKGQFETVPKFELTEEGQKFYTPNAKQHASGGSSGGFCMGKATVVEVSQFTEPADAYGNRISRVTYSYTVSELPAWAKNPAVLKAFEELDADVASAQKPVEKQDVLVLTNNGWVHQKLFKGRL